MKVNAPDRPSIKEKPLVLLEARILISFVRRITINPRKTLAPYIRQGMKILDYGCGMGFFSLPAAALAGASGKTVCVDIHATMLEALEKRAAATGLSGAIETRLAATPGVISEKDGFDFAFSVAVIHEIPGAGETICAILSALKPGGRFLLAEPKGHVSKNNFQASTDLCVSCGFHIIEYPQVSIHNAVLLGKPIS